MKDIFYLMLCFIIILVSIWLCKNYDVNQVEAEPLTMAVQTEVPYGEVIQLDYKSDSVTVINADVIKTADPATPKPTKKPKKAKKKHKAKKPEYVTKTCKVTAYCGCSKCCGSYGNITSTGVTPKAGRTIAVDPSLIPYGTKVIIGDNTYVAEDCGGAIKGNRIDIYFESHQDALNWGVQYIDVAIKKE